MLNCVSNLYRSRCGVLIVSLYSTVYFGEYMITGVAIV